MLNNDINNDPKINSSPENNDVTNIQETSSFKDSEKDKKIELLEKENNELSNKVKYLLAEISNTQKKNMRDIAFFSEKAKKSIIDSFLYFFDDFERLVQNKKSNEGSEEGFDLVYKSYFKMCKELGIEEIDTTKEFNPEFHESIGYVEKDPASQNHSGAIGSVVRKGYLLNGSVLRPAQVLLFKE